MTIADVIKRVDAQRGGCNMELCEYITYLNILESDIYANVISCHEEAESFTPHTSEEDLLLVPDTYADLYVFYMLARIDLSNSDTVGYANNMILYNNLMGEYSRHYTRNHMPIQKARIGWS